MDSESQAALAAGVGWNASDAWRELAAGTAPTNVTDAMNIFYFYEASIPHCEVQHSVFGNQAGQTPRTH